MLKLLVFGSICVLITYIMYTNYDMNNTIREFKTRSAEILNEDVVTRMLEAQNTDDVESKYRKIREAHASFESLIALHDGLDNLGDFITEDLADLDDEIRKLTKAIKHACGNRKKNKR